MKGFGDLAGLFKQAQQVKEKIEEVQGQLANETITATAGGGMVTITVNGKLQVVDLSLEPEVVNPEEIPMLKDLLLAAIAEGQRRAEEMAKEKMRTVAGGLNINLPGIT